MGTNNVLGIVLLIIGVALLIYGFNASQSVASGFSKLFQGTPSDKTIWLVIGGAVLSAIGLVNLLRRRPST